MSVPEFKRTQGRLQIFAAAYANCKHTINICRNEKHFPKRNRWLLTNDIVAEAKEILRCCQMANNITVNSYEDYAERRRYQMEAKGHANTQLTLMQIAYELLNPGVSMEAWIELVDKFLALLNGWMDSDRRRYSKYVPKEPQK